MPKISSSKNHPVSAAFTQKAKMSRLQMVVLIAMVALSAISTDLYLSGFTDMTKSLNSNPSEVQLTLTFFMLGFAGGQLISGPLSDHYGRLPVLKIHLVFYIFASIACFLVVNIEMMWLARFIQGLAAAAGPVLGRAMVADLYERQEAASLMSHMASAMAIVPALAPILGSVLLHWFPWQSHFIALSIFGFCLLFAVHFILFETSPPQGGQALTRIRRIFTSSFLKNKQFLAYVVLASCAFGSMFAYISVASYLVTQVLGIDNTYFGYTFAFNILGLFLAASINARIIKYVRIERILGLGAGILLCTGVVLLIFQFHYFTLPLLLICMFLVFAVGGMTMSNTQAAAISLFRTQAGSASAIFGLLQTGSAALTGTLAGYFYAGTALPLAIIITLCGVISLLTWWFCFADTTK